MAIAETAKLFAELSLKNRMSAGIKSAQRSVGGLERSLGHGLQSAARNTERIVVGGALAAGGAIAYSAKQAGDFEAQLNTINTVAQLTGDAFSGSLGEVGERIRQISRDTGTATSDLTAAYYDLVSAGISAADAQNVLANANTLAIGGLSTTSEAVDLLTTAINSYGGDASKATEITNMFARSIAAGKVTASEMAASFASVGPIAAKFGIGIDEIAAALGVMTAKGTPAAEAFTQMRAAIVALMKPNSALAALQEKTGTNFAKLAQKKGLAFAYTELTKAAEKADVPLAKLTGRVEGTLFAAQVAGDSFAAYSEELDNVRASSEGAGDAQEQAEKRMQGFNFAVSRLQANVNDAAITIGQALIPTLADLAGEATAFLQQNQGQIKSFATSLAGWFRDAVTWAKRIDWSGITDAVRTAAGFAKDLVGAFLNAPTWLQTAVITGWGLNKFTGGALGDIFGQLASGLIKGVLGINAGVVNVTGKVVNGGVGAGPAAAGAAAGGGVSGLLNAAMKVLIVGLVAEAAQAIQPTLNKISQDLHDQFLSALPDLSTKDLEWPFGPKNTPTILPEIFGGNGLLGGAAAAGPITTGNAVEGIGDALRAPFSALLAQMRGQDATLTSAVHALPDALGAAVKGALISEHLGQYLRELSTRFDRLRAEGRERRQEGDTTGAKLIEARLAGIAQKEELVRKGIEDLRTSQNPKLTAIANSTALAKARLGNLQDRLRIAERGGATQRAEHIRERIAEVKISINGAHVKGNRVEIDPPKVPTPKALPSREAAATARAVDSSRVAIVDEVNAAGDTFDRATSVAKAATVSALSSLNNTTRSGTAGTTGAVNNAASRIVGAFHSLPAPIVNVNISATNITRETNYTERYGGGTGSAGGGGGGGKKRHG